MPQSLESLSPVVLAAIITIVGSVVSLFVRGFLEKQRTNKAVLAEIRRLLVVIKKHREWYRGLPVDKRQNFPLIPFSYLVYTKQVENIGVLRRHLVAKAVQFYGYVDFLNALQSTRTEHKQPADFDDIYLRALGQCESDFFHHFDDDFRNMGIPLPEEAHNDAA